MTTAEVIAPDGELVEVALRAGPAGRMYVLCPAGKRPASSRTVHLAQVTKDGSAALVAGSPLCGVKPGPLQDDLGPGEYVCRMCKETAEPPPAAPEPDREQQAWQVERDLRFTDMLALGEVRGHFMHRPDGCSEVALNAAAPLLVSLIKDVPGRVYDGSKRAWIVPTAWAPDLAAALAAQGVEVRETAVPAQDPS